MRLAYVVQAHREPAQVARLIDAVAADGAAVALAWDLKAGSGFVPAIRASLRGPARASLIVLPPTDNAWGGWSLPAALVAGYGALLREGGRWDVAINLSGQCLPTQPADALRARLAAAPGASFMECFELEREWPAALPRVRRWHVEWRGRIRDTRLPRPAPPALPARWPRPRARPPAAARTARPAWRGWWRRTAT